MLGLSEALGETDGLGLGLTLALGDVEALGLVDGEVDGLSLALGLTEALGLVEAELEELGLTEALGLADGEVEELGDGLALADEEAEEEGEETGVCNSNTTAELPAFVTALESHSLVPMAVPSDNPELRAIDAPDPKLFSDSNLVVHVGLV